MDVSGAYVSRADRLGDLVLSLPVLGLLRAAGLPWLGLHVSSYAEDVALWAYENGLCEAVYSGTDVKAVAQCAAEPSGPRCAGISLFHDPTGPRLFRAKALGRSFGPRSKLSSLWSYGKTLAQHRSRVEKSEAAYNLELAAWSLRELGVRVPEFRGLPALRVPASWRAPRESPEVIVVATNRGSAGDWPFSKYLEWIEGFASQGKRVDVLLHGVEARERVSRLRETGVLDRGVELVESFGRVRELIAYIAGAKLVVSSSTGPLHIAHAAGVPVVCVYPAEPRVESFDRWRPDGYWHAAGVRLIEIDQPTSWTPERC